MPTTLTTLQMIIMGLSFVVGLVNVTIQTGKLLNQYAVPAKVMPYVVIFGSFLAGFFGYIEDATALGGAVLFSACFAGGMSLLAGLTPGVVSHHFGAQVNVKRPEATPAPIASVINAAKGAAGTVAAIALLCIVAPALGISAANEGCVQATAAAPPAINLAACVAEGALAGDSLAQLVDKCGADVPAVIAALLTSKEPAIKATVAHAEARRAVAVDAGDQ